MVGCGAWPADLVTAIPSTNKVNLQDTGSFVSPTMHLNKSPGDPGYDVRWDLVPGSAAGPEVSIQDMGSLILLAPPMLGGVKAFNGPECSP
jgi:hypothetical protein